MWHIGLDIYGFSLELNDIWNVNFRCILTIQVIKPPNLLNSTLCIRTQWYLYTRTVTRVNHQTNLAREAFKRSDTLNFWHHWIITIFQSLRCFSDLLLCTNVYCFVCYYVSDSNDTTLPCRITQNGNGKEFPSCQFALRVSIDWLIPFPSSLTT